MHLLRSLYAWLRPPRPQVGASSLLAWDRMLGQAVLDIYQVRWACTQPQPRTQSYGKGHFMAGSLSLTPRLTFCWPPEVRGTWAPATACGNWWGPIACMVQAEARPM